ncbi:MAG: membrane integrity-associated transporter subunit PqiC [Sphingomonadales bacterium]|nr:membrane integrity-associated transporter subunit PqiC [Sphingomonadales bacterium]
MGENQVAANRLTVRAGLALALALSLGGCLGGLAGGAKPPPALLRLVPAEAAPAGSSASGKPTEAIMVMEPETENRLAVLRVPVQINAVDVAYLKDAQWVERPARQFRALLAERLRAKGGRLVLEDDQPVPATGTRLGGKLIDLDYDARRQSAVVRFDALRTTPAGQVTTRRFEAVVPTASAKPTAVGNALNQAANDVAGQVVEWMGS